MDFTFVKKQIEGSELFDVNRIDSAALGTYLENGHVVASEEEWIEDSTSGDAITVETPVEATEEVVSEEAPAEEVAEVEA